MHLLETAYSDEEAKLEAVSNTKIMKEIELKNLIKSNEEHSKKFSSSISKLQKPPSTSSNLQFDSHTFTLKQSIVSHLTIDQIQIAKKIEGLKKSIQHHQTLNDELSKNLESIKEREKITREIYENVRYQCNSVLHRDNNKIIMGMTQDIKQSYEDKKGNGYGRIKEKPVINRESKNMYNTVDKIIMKSYNNINIAKDGLVNVYIDSMSPDEISHYERLKQNKKKTLKEKLKL